MLGDVWKSISGNAADRRCSLQGSLWKLKRDDHQRAFVPKWTKRWFSIEGPELKWYSSPNSVEASGHISMSNIIRVEKVKSNSGIYSFAVVSKSQRLLHLRAETKSEVEKWSRAIEMHADLTKGGDGTSLVTESSVSASLKVMKRRTWEDQIARTERDIAYLEQWSNNDDSRRHLLRRIDNYSSHAFQERSYSNESKADDDAETVFSIECSSSSDAEDSSSSSGQSFVVNTKSFDQRPKDNYDCPTKKTVKTDAGKRSNKMSTLFSRKRPKIYFTE